MLQLATFPEAELICADDPVRPTIPVSWRIEGHHREVYFARLNDFFEMFPEMIADSVGACLCLAYLQEIPTTEEELMTIPEGPEFAIFYSVWSNRKGQGKKIVNDVCKHLKKQMIMSNRYTRYVTMSPKTKMAKNFHLGNGALLLQENPLTYNFEYLADRKKGSKYD